MPRKYSAGASKEVEKMMHEHNANVLVVALVPLAMLVSMVAGLAGMLVPMVAGWFAWPAGLLLTYMLDIANLLSRVPHSFVQGVSLPLGQLIALYVMIVVLCAVLWHRTKRLESAIVTDEIEATSEQV